MSDVDEIVRKTLNDAAVAERVSRLRNPTTLYDELRSRIAAALRAERAKVLTKFAAFADENGEPLKVVEAYEDETNGPWHGRTVFVCERPAAEAAKEQQ